MPHLSLDALAQRLSEQLQCEQEELCLLLLHQEQGQKQQRTAASGLVL
jgi:hypothetical protein